MEELESLIENRIATNSRRVARIKPFPKIMLYITVTCFFIVFCIDAYNSREKTFEERADPWLITTLFFSSILIYPTGIVGLQLYKFFKISIPQRITNYLRQQRLLNVALNSNRPFVLILRSFNNGVYLSSNLKQFKNDLSAMFNWREPDIQSEKNGISSLDNKLKELQLFGLYVGKVNSCNNRETLENSLFLSANIDWFQTVELLMRNSLITIIIPDKTGNLNFEIEHLKNQDLLSKTLIFIPKMTRHNESQERHWKKIYHNLESLGITLPYCRFTDEDLYLKIDSSYMPTVDLKTECKERVNITKCPGSQNTLQELIEKKLISPNYYLEYRKYYKFFGRFNNCNLPQYFSKSILLEQ